MRTANDRALRRAGGKMCLHALVRTLVFGPMLAGAGLLAGCNQDSYASTPERDTHMGDIRAVPDLSAAPSAEVTSPSAAGSVAPPAAVQPNPGAPAAAPTPGVSPDAGAAPSNPSPVVPAGSGKEPRTRPAPSGQPGPGKANPP